MPRPPRWAGGACASASPAAHRAAHSKNSHSPRAHARAEVGRGRDDAREERGAHVRARRLGVEVGRVAPARVAVERAAEARADAPVLECDARKADLARDLGEAAGDAEAAVAGALDLVAVVGPLVIACEHVRVVHGARAVAPKGRLREHVAAEFS